MTSCLLSCSTKPFPKGVYSYKNELSSGEANSFFLELTLTVKGSNNENGRVAVIESASVLLTGEKIASLTCVKDGTEVFG